MRKPSAPPPVQVPQPELQSWDLAPILGQNLRRLRAERGLSLEKLARQSGVSRAMLGQIELARSVPTINVLWKIAKALELPFASLISSSGKEGVRVMRQGEARRLTSRDGSFVSRALFPFDQPRKAEFYELRLKGHAVENAHPHPQGTVENLVVARGQVEIAASDQVHRLEEGDAVVFPADGPHAYRNLGSKEAVMYLVMTYASEKAAG